MVSLLVDFDYSSIAGFFKGAESQFLENLLLIIFYLQDGCLFLLKDPHDKIFAEVDTIVEHLGNLIDGEGVAERVHAFAAAGAANIGAPEGVLAFLVKAEFGDSLALGAIEFGVFELEVVEFLVD